MLKEKPPGSANRNTVPTTGAGTGSNHWTLFISGRRIRTAVVYEAVHGLEPRSPQEEAQGYQVPLPAILEALDYVAQISRHRLAGCQTRQ